MRAWDDPFARELATFRPPEDLARLLESSAAALNGEPLFRGPRGKLRKEAWLAAAWSVGYQAMMHTRVEVRVVPDESFADFQLRVDGATLNFQSTMAVNGRNGNGHHAEPVPPDVRDAAIESAGGFDPVPLIMAARRKADGRDTRGVHLLISSRVASATAEHARVARVVSETLGDAYESAWVVTDEHLLCAKVSPALPATSGWIRLPIHTPPLE